MRLVGYLPMVESPAQVLLFDETSRQVTVADIISPCCKARSLPGKLVPYNRTHLSTLLHNGMEATTVQVS